MKIMINENFMKKAYNCIVWELYVQKATEKPLNQISNFEKL